MDSDSESVYHEQGSSYGHPHKRFSYKKRVGEMRDTKPMVMTSTKDMK